jgi:hypothetical protein
MKACGRKVSEDMPFLVVTKPQAKKKTFQLLKGQTKQLAKAERVLLW